MTVALEIGAPRRHHDEPTMDLDPPFQRVIRLIRRRSRLIVACGVFGAILGGVVGLLLPPRYTATAEIATEPQSPVLTGGQLPAVTPPEDESTVQSYMVALTSRGHLERVLDSLAHDPRVRPVPKTAEEAAGLLDTLRGPLNAWLADAWDAAGRPVMEFLSPTRPPGAAIAAHGTTPSGAAVEAFKRHLLVFQERGSHVLAVSFSSTDPQGAARAANRVAQLYVNTLYDQKRETTQRTLAWIGKRIPELKQEIDRAETAAQAYRTEHGLAQGNETDVQDQRLADLNRRVTAADAALVERQAQLNSVGALQRTGAGVDTLIGTIDSPTLRELRSRELALQQSQAQLSATLGERHPRTQAILAELRAVRGSIAVAARRVGSDLNAQVKAASLQLQTLRAQLAAAQTSSNQARRAGAHLQDLERGAATVRQVYESLLQRREVLIEQQEMISPDVRILSLATPPDRPSSVNPLLFPLPGMVLFLIAGTLVAIIADGLDQGMRSARDVSETLAIPCIGLVPQVKRTRRMPPHQQLLSKPLAPYAEAIRSVAASLQMATPTGTPQTILLSSSVPREGKTTLAVSLAVYAAVLGRRVILVDFDFRRPTLWREVAGRRNRGIPNRAAKNRLSTAAIETIPRLGLDILPIRRRPDDPLLPFAGGELRRLLGQLRSSYDCIIIDGPPLLAVTEARLLATLVDKILFVVKWGSTRKDMAQNAMGLLRDTRLFARGGDDVVAGVVTQVDINKHARYRYGDVGESFVRYARYYLESSDFRIESKEVRRPANGARPLPRSGDEPFNPTP